MDTGSRRTFPRRAVWITAAVTIVLAAATAWTLAQDRKAAPPKTAESKPVDGAKTASTARPALTVTTTTAQASDWPQVLAANGNIAAWQEAVIGAEISNFRLTEVLVNVGDVVKKGQLLARVSSDMVNADWAQTKAAIAEAEATLAEARANADRARDLQPSGALSGQQINQLLTAEQTAAARLNSVRAKLQADEVRLAHTRIVAPDDGVISARTATVGSLTQPGLELFRLIRGGRLEWRAEVTATELARIKPGVTARVVLPDGNAVAGKVRAVAPTVDPQTRNALVYVDLLPAAVAPRAGMFARGEFELGRTGALTLPQSAVLLRDGFSYVFALEGENRVAQKKVTVGRRAGDRIEVTSGLAADTAVVATGAGFLADGDTVRVVQSSASAAAAAAGSVQK